MAVDGYAEDRFVVLYDEFNEGTWDTDFYAAALAGPARRRECQARRRPRRLAGRNGPRSARGPFDAAVMTGHAFQCLLTDDEILETLVEVRRRLAPTGRFLFETRNPARKAWLD